MNDSVSVRHPDLISQKCTQQLGNAGCWPDSWKEKILYNSLLSKTGVWVSLSLLGELVMCEWPKQDLIPSWKAFLRLFSPQVMMFFSSGIPGGYCEGVSQEQVTNESLGWDHRSWKCIMSSSWSLLRGPHHRYCKRIPTLQKTNISHLGG